MQKKLTGWVLDVLCVLAFAAGLWMVFVYAPREATMGDVQRIFYFHVSSAWIGFFGFFVTAVAGAAYLITQRRIWDSVALSSANVGLVFISMVLVTGMLWAKPVWGTYWTWEPRLTISAVQWLVYIAYTMLRGSLNSPEREARFASVYGIVAFVTVPLSWFAIRWWRTIHPQIVSSEGMALTPKMTTTLFFSLGVFTLLYAVLMYHRIRLELSRERLSSLRELEED